MPKSAQEAVIKWAERAGVASDDYTREAQQTTKDQSQLAIAAKEIAKQAIISAFDKGLWEAGLRKSGRAGWLAGILEKGATNYATGVSSPRAQQKYISESSRFDAARNASAAMARGAKGSAVNLAKVAKVVAALRAVKTGSPAA